MSLRHQALALLALAFGVTACGPRPADTGHPTPGAMPEGGSFRGMYQGPYHIALNIWTEGTKASGTWRAVGDREGEFYGTVFGNMLIINWAEQAGKSAERYTGRGYFVYSVPEAGKPHQIYGEWGVGKTGLTSPWWALKRSNEPVGSRALIDKDADEQDRDGEPGCEMGGCDTLDTETQ